MATTETKFAFRVRTEMQRQGLTIKGLARKIDPANVERARRNLHRWLDEGMRPNRSSRREIAAALGLDADSLNGDEDDEESDLAMRATFLLFVDLMDRIQSRNNEPSGSRQEASLGSVT